MKTYLKTGLFFAILLTVVSLSAPVADAAQWIKVDEIKIDADKNVSPMDYSFGQRSAPTRLELGTLKNLYGNGAGFIIYIDTSEQRGKWLSFKVDSGTLSARIVGQPGGIVSFPPSTISNNDPLVLEIRDDVLTISAGKMRRTVNGVYGFSGSMTTQSIETTLKVFNWQED
ncbi:MAG TPA: hypothetical protein VN611_13580 [Patescibacteria group bacterium]|nr:hypothetical protein [Patescibacteria group bacterium]